MSGSVNGRPLQGRQVVLSVVVAAAALAVTYGWESARQPPDPAGSYTITMTDYRFSVGQMVWRVGETVTLTLVEASEASPPRPHEFMVGRVPRTSDSVFGMRQEDGFETPFFTDVTIEIIEGGGVQMLMPGGAKFTGLAPMQVMTPGPMDMHDMDMDSFMPVVGARGFLKFSFVVPDKPGDWTFGCFQQSGQHFLNGMNGTVTVLPGSA